MSTTAKSSSESQTVEKNTIGGLRMLRAAMMIVFIAVPLANFVLSPILGNGEQFADDPEVRVAAAGYAFAIWGVIFTGMLGFSGYLVFGSEPDSRELRIAVTGLIVAGLASIAFVPISIYLSQTAGWIDIMAHLIPLIIATFFLRSHVKQHPRGTLGRWLFFGPSMYLGWISAATVISTALLANEWQIKLPEATATIVATLVVILLCAVGVWMTLKRDPVYGGTVCWALIAVGVKQSSYPMIQYTAWGAAFVLAITIGMHLVRQRPAYYAVQGKS